MSKRITIKDLENKARTLNKIFDRPLKAFEQVGNPNIINYVWNEGHFYINGEAGGYNLYEVITSEGAARNVFKLGAKSPKELVQLIDVYITGMIDASRDMSLNQRVKRS